MKKRSAYVGLSGPICYDYETMNKNFPNPILEAPLGLLVFYNEVVFLHESLCPKSIQNLEFVRFLSDSVDLKDYFEEVENIQKTEPDDIGSNKIALNKLNTNWERDWNQINSQYMLIVNEIGSQAIRADNHSLPLEFGKYHVRPNSKERLNVAYDNFIAGQEGLSFVTNSAINNSFTHYFNSLGKSILTNTLLAKRIPNYVNEEGPYVEIIENIRNRRLLKEFREKIDHFIGTQDYKSIEEYSKKLEEEFNAIRNELANRVFAKTRPYNSIMSFAKALLSEGLKSIPGLGIAISTYDVGKEFYDVHKDRKNYGWTGLLIDLENYKMSKNKSVN